MENDGSLAAAMSAAARPDMQQFDSSGTSGEELDYSAATSQNGDGITPMTNASAQSWTPNLPMYSSRTNSLRETPSIVTNGLHNSIQKQNRPGAVRQITNAYAPQRRPQQYISHPSSRQRQGSAHRGPRRDPNAQYRAQEQAYVQRVRQDARENDFFGAPRTPSLDDYSTDSEDESDGSRSVNEFLDKDGYDQELLIFYGNEDMEPSVEEMKIPANKERLEWHAMLANVLTGDVVKQEKKRLIGGLETQGENALKNEIWTGVRAKACGRTVATQTQILDNGRSKVRQQIESVIAFEIKGEAEAGKSVFDQVQDIVKRIEKIENLYPTRQALEAAHPNAATPAYADMCATIYSWHNTTEMINVQLSILQKWVGNPELDLTKPRVRPEDDSQDQLFDESSFIDRILKEDGLRSLQGDNSLLESINAVIQKAKQTLINNSNAYVERHLPPYFDELLTLINFPSRLIQEIIKIRLSYAGKMKYNAQQGVLMAEQMLLQFQILLKVAVKIKESYLQIARSEPGWELPPCIDENFDADVIEALKVYFMMLNWKLSANKNTFKEAEILEQEWEFCAQLGRFVQGGDVEVAEQFSSLTSKSLQRLTSHFERELQKRPDEVAGAEMDKRYKAIFDSVRVRQRKIFRFSRILAQRFENATEYNINVDQVAFQELVNALALSDHALVNATESGRIEPGELGVIVCPNLLERSKDIESMLGTCYHAEEGPEDTSNPYVLIIKAEHPIVWHGAYITTEVQHPPLQLKMGRLRLVADGSQQRLMNANAAFVTRTSIELDTLVDQRANLPGVALELHKIRKTQYKLSESIMDSVQIVRTQTAGLQCQELVQTCFTFATEFGQRSAIYMDQQRRAMHHLKLTNIALDWVSFICDDCVASDRKTFRWAVVALEFAMMMTRGQSILSISENEYATLRKKVAGCMSLLISHFDIMGARSTVAALLAKKNEESSAGKLPLKLTDDDESARLVWADRVKELEKMDALRKDKEDDRQALGRVLETSNEADRALTQLSASVGNVHMRWQQGQFVGGGTFGSVYTAINLDSTQIMAVKEIRLQDPKLIPTVVSQIRDEMGVLQVLDHPNVVQYYGIEPHRDKVYIFMEYCSGGSLAALLEHGRIEDETFIQVYAFQMLEGLAYLHEANVVHRDIKPENILLDHNGVIKFVDFGAAKVIAKQSKTIVAEGPNGKGRQNSVQGTPMYMSPEVIRGGKNHHSRLGAEDIWSLGCVISEMATGSRPWSSMDNEWAIMYNIAQGHSPQMPTKEQMSDCGLDFLKRCFERDPIKRASAAELLQHDWISAIRAQLSLEPSTPQTPASENSSYSSSSPSTLSRESTLPEAA